MSELAADVTELDSPRQSSSRCTPQGSKARPQGSDSTKRVSGKPGAVQVLPSPALMAPVSPRVDYLVCEICCLSFLRLIANPTISSPEDKISPHWERVGAAIAKGIAVI